MFTAYTNNHNTFNFQSNRQSISRIPQFYMGGHGCGKHRQCRCQNSIDCCEYQNQHNYPLGLLNRLKLDDFTPNKLKLRVGSIIMFIYNLNRSSGLTNGTRARMKNLHSKIQTPKKTQFWKSYQKFKNN